MKIQAFILIGVVALGMTTCAQTTNDFKQQQNQPSYSIMR